MTNLEWLRTLSAGDLAKLFWNSCEVCAYHNNCELESGDYSECDKGISMWLEQKYIEEVKPCGNCGGRAIVDRNQNSVHCEDCGMSTPWTDSIEDAIKTWNRRANDGRSE